MIETGNDALRRYQEDLLKRFTSNNSKESSDAVLFVGDSIIEFFPLKKYLGRERQLINRGVSGIDSNWLLEHILELALVLSPSHLVIGVGTNDIGRGYSPNDILGRLNDLVALIRSESYATQIHFLSILPVNESVTYQEVVKCRTNQAIQEVNQSLSFLPVDFINLYPLLLDEEGQLAAAYTTDGLHLSQSGYEVIADYLRLHLF